MTAQIRIKSGSKGAFVLLLLLVLVARPRVAAAQSWKWTIEDVDTAGQDTSIIADQDGNLHLSYHVNEGFGELRYAFRSAADSRWYKMTLDKAIGEAFTGIGLDSHGNPGICYTPRSMKYASWNGQKWLLQEVDSGSGLITYYCSVKFTPDDRPQLSWYLESVFVLRYAALEDGVWKVRSVETGTESGKWNSLALDQKQAPHLAYNSFKTGELRYAYLDGGNWVRRALDSPGPGDVGLRGMGASLVLDAQDNPSITYYDLHELKYAHFDGKSWVKQVIEPLPPFVDWSWKNFRSKLLLDGNGMPHVCYESYLGLKHAWFDGKRWHTQLIRGPIGNSFFESSMTLDANGNIYISFTDPQDNSLKVAIGRSTVPISSDNSGSIQQTANKDK